MNTQVKIGDLVVLPSKHCPLMGILIEDPTNHNRPYIYIKDTVYAETYKYMPIEVLSSSLRKATESEVATYKRFYPEYVA